MKKVGILLTILVLIVGPLRSSPNDSIKTIYKGGEFSTYSQMSVYASDSISNEVINKFVYQMCYDLNGLFKWGLKNMGMANSKDNLVYFDFKTTKYDRKTQILRGIGDVIVPGVKTFSDVYVDSKVTQKKYVNGKREVRLELATDNPFIKKMIGTYTFYPKNGNRPAFYSINTDIKFDWFFDIFITQSKYKKILEWRLRQLIKNMKEESETREKLWKRRIIVHTSEPTPN